MLAGFLLAGTARVGPAPLAASFQEKPSVTVFSADEGERFKRRARLVRVPEEDTPDAVYEQPDGRLAREIAVALGFTLGFLGLSSAVWAARRRRRFLGSL